MWWSGTCAIRPSPVGGQWRSGLSASRVSVQGSLLLRSKFILAFKNTIGPTFRRAHDCHAPRFAQWGMTRLELFLYDRHPSRTERDNDTINVCLTTASLNSSCMVSSTTGTTNDQLVGKINDPRILLRRPSQALTSMSPTGKPVPRIDPCGAV